MRVPLSLRFIDPHTREEAFLRLAEFRGSFWLHGKWYPPSQKGCLAEGDKIRIRRHPNPLGGRGKRPPKIECDAEVVRGKNALSREQRLRGEMLWQIAARAYFKKTGVKFDPKDCTTAQAEAWESAVFAVLHASRQRAGEEG